MNWELRRRQSIFVGVFLVALFFVHHVYAGRPRPERPYRHSVVDMPVSLAVGTVQTPEFSGRTSWYWIMVRVEPTLPFNQMRCMMGTTSGPLERTNCDYPLLRADWVAWEDGHIVLSGSSTTEGDAKFGDDHIIKFIGSFPVLSGKKYVVVVKFTRDGTPLNVANPHLIITKIGGE